MNGRCDERGGARPPAAVEAGWSDWPAPAKLNLFLHIIGRRADGYHLLQTTFQLLDWGDRVRVNVRADGVIRRVDPLPGVAAHEDLAVARRRPCAPPADRRWVRTSRSTSAFRSVAVSAAAAPTRHHAGRAERAVEDRPG